MGKPASFHQQLIAKLRKLLRSRQHVPGSQFLTEREIAERFQTSRPTANKALSSLVSEGLLEFRQGANPYAGRRNNLSQRQQEKRRRLMSHVKKK